MVSARTRCDTHAPEVTTWHSLHRPATKGRPGLWGHRDRAAIGDRLIAGVDDGDGGEAVVAGDGGGAPLVNGGDELDVFGEVGVPVEVGPRDDGGLAQFFVAGADDGGAGLKRANGDQAVGADDFDPRVVGVLDTLGAGDGPLGAGVKVRKLPARAYTSVISPPVNQRRVSMS